MTATTFFAYLEHVQYIPMVIVKISYCGHHPFVIEKLGKWIFWMGNVGQDLAYLRFFLQIYTLMHTTKQ